MLPPMATLHDDRRTVVGESHRRTKLVDVGEKRIGRHDLSPDGDDLLVSDRTINQLKDVGRIIVWVKANHPIVSPAAHGESQLLAVAPLPVAGLDARRC